MPDRRRRLFYVDRRFQKKLILLLAGLNLLIVVANGAFYSLFLKSELERHTYVSHIRLSHLHDILLGEVIWFNVFLAALSIMLVGIVLVGMHLKMRRFFGKLQAAIRQRIGTPGGAPAVRLGEGLSDSEGELEAFFHEIDRRLQAEQVRVSKLKECTGAAVK